MGENHSLIQRLVASMRRQGLSDFAALLVEAGQPLAPLGAQLSYLVEPLLGGPNGPLREVGQLLEDPKQLEQLVQQLHGAESSE